jgi:hypothetical protein
MAFCTKCGSQNVEGAAHCSSCGTQMPAAAGAPHPVAAPATSAAPPMAPPMGYAAPVAPAAPNFFTVLWASLDVGAKIAGVGAIVVVISFFLPFYEGVNGVNMANGTGGGGDASWWFRFLLPLVALGLLYFYYNNDLRTKIIVATGHCIIGSMWGFAIFRIALGGQYTSGVQFGWYAMHFGFLAIVIGGFMSILDLTRRLAGVR